MRSPSKRMLPLKKFRTFGTSSVLLFVAAVGLRTRQEPGGLAAHGPVDEAGRLGVPLVADAQRVQRGLHESVPGRRGDDVAVRVIGHILEPVRVAGQNGREEE